MQQLFLNMFSLLIILTFDHEYTKFNEQTNTQNIDRITSFHPQEEVDPRVLVCHISGRVLDGELWRADGVLQHLPGTGGSMWHTGGSDQVKHLQEGDMSPLETTRMVLTKICF